MNETLLNYNGDWSDRQVGYSLIQQACETGDEELAIKVYQKACQENDQMTQRIKDDPDPRFPNYYHPRLHGDLPLVWAAKAGMNKLVRLTYKRGAIQVDDALNWACDLGHFETVKLLCQLYKGVRLDHGFSWACHGDQRNPQVMKYLADLGVRKCHWPKCPYKNQFEGHKV